MRALHSVLLTLVGLAPICLSASADDRRAEINYMLNCQGCHTQDGSGHEGRNIPSLKNYMGKFLKVEGGREFLIQVPGASQSSLSDLELAELTNWMLEQFDPESLAAGFKPYNAEEVKTLRINKIIDFTPARNRLVTQIEKLP